MGLGDFEYVSAEVLMLIFLDLTVGVSLDFRPREIFFKCLYIIIRKDKENKVRGSTDGLKSGQLYKNISLL